MGCSVSCGHELRIRAWDVTTGITIFPRATHSLINCRGVGVLVGFFRSCLASLDFAQGTGNASISICNAHDVKSETDSNTKYMTSYATHYARRRAEASKTGDAGITCLMTEFPSNPLLNIPDLLKLRKLADQYNFLLVVDDTIGNFANVDLLSEGVADVICTSLTKLFNGRGDAIAGSVVIGEQGKRSETLKRLMNDLHGGSNGDLWSSDAQAIAVNSRDFLRRSNQINVTAERLADWLRTREEVENVYYPKFTQPELYTPFLTGEVAGHKSGYGGLLAVTLKAGHDERIFYDSLEICKGPSLGTNFTLACPYTLLAHYHELEFAQAYNVDPNLVRVAVGLEKVRACECREAPS